MPTTITHKLSDSISDILMTVLYISFIALSMNVYGVYLMVCLTVAIFLININRQTINFHIGLYHKYIFLFAVFSFLSSIWAINAGYAIEKGVTLLQLLAVFTLLYSAYYYADIERLLKIMMWGGMLLALYTISFYGVGALQETLENEGRLENSFANVNSIGMACCSSIIIALYLFRKDKNFIHLILCLPAILIAAGSGSRKALVMLILGFLFVFLYQNRERRGSKKLLKIIGAVVVLVVVLYVVMASSIFAGSISRMEGLIASFTGSGNVDSSSMLREYYRLLGFNQFLETPILGIGMGNGRVLALATTGHDCYLHCNYAELAANGGIVGLALYYWIYIPIIKKERKDGQLDFYAPLILFLVLLQLVMDYGAVSYYSKQTYFLLMVVMLHLNKLRSAKLAK